MTVDDPRPGEPGDEPDDARAGDTGPHAPRGARHADQSDIDAAFAALVAGWGTATPGTTRDDPPGEDPVPTDPAAPDPATHEEPPAARREIASSRPATGPGTGPRDTTGPVEDEDEGHWKPPEPPSIPRLPVPALGALLLLAAGIGLIVAPGVLGLTDGVGLPLGLLLCAGGLGWLLSRLRAAPDPDSGWDDGARL